MSNGFLNRQDLVIPTDGSDITTNSSYQWSLEKAFAKLEELVKAGHSIIWSFNKRFCTCAGKTFNIPKILYDKRYNRQTVKVEAQVTLGRGRHNK